MRKNSIKNTRINMEMMRELSQILRSEIKDPRVSRAMISVTACEVTPDLKYCKVYLSTLGGEEDAKAVLQGVKSATGYIRRRLAAGMNLRNTPELSFIMDQSIAHGVSMTHFIDEVTKDLPPAEESEQNADE